MSHKAIFDDVAGHEIRSKSPVRTNLGDVPAWGGLRHGRFSNICIGKTDSCLIEPIIAVLAIPKASLKDLQGHPGRILWEPG
jgi:hypothetical protein